MKADTCSPRKVQLDTLFQPITWFKRYYQQFEEDNQSDYQLIYIVLPGRDEPGRFQYYKGCEQTGYDGFWNNVNRFVLTTPQKDSIVTLMKDIPTGSYFNFCDEDVNAIGISYSICAIKQKEKLVFLYQAINGDIMHLKKEDKIPFQNITSIIKKLER
ncbi:hypothetical protein LX64_01964 [Chitinophaga skermanii]|uniref:Uncharacterized protein n=1 Tax=Chitinophaga skermanii TaxID=331697 RepID=A0A327QYU8_9BACT|nr:hypothetical protein [Chitinophaga skermanii]RAJ06837.1 hypothetical protein LX64_01964 [Chitinophaga skermanii]